VGQGLWQGDQAKNFSNRERSEMSEKREGLRIFLSIVPNQLDEVSG
jgi:hypothetical protein